MSYKLIGNTLAVFLVIMILLVSCEQTNKKIEGEPESSEDELTHIFKHPGTDQTFKIVHVYTLYENYEKELENNPDEHELSLYKQEVIDPIFEDCFEDVKYPQPNEVLAMRTDAPTDLENIQDIVDKIDSEKMNSIVEEALIKSSEMLPSDEDKNVCIFPPVESLPNNTIAGLALGINNIVYFHNGYYDEESIKAGIAHEYQHTVQEENDHYKSNDEPNILDIIVREGKSVMFERMVYPESNFNSVRYNYDNVDYWPEVEPDLFNVDYIRAEEILFGGNEFPFNYGYSEGYKIVKSYLDLHPEVTVEEWTGLSGKEIYEESDYADSQ